MARGSAGRRQIVPGVHKALDAMKYEIAAELGLPVGRGRANGFGDAEFASELGAVGGAGGQEEDYWGHIASRDAGAVGGHMTRRLIQQAQKQLLNL